jgi:dipeptidyl aminopeptidase/acylaminoacyl peptidase
MTFMQTFFVILLVIIIIIVIFSFILSFVFSRRYTLHNPRTPAEVGLNYEEVTFRSSDGLTLHGWWVPCEGSEKVIIQLHGYGGSMDPDIQHLTTWHEHGCNVLMFDFRGHGRSPGKIVTLGYLERQDVRGAIDFVRQRGFNRIALVGFSMGGVLAILSGAINPEVKAIISDSAPVHLTTAIRERGVELHLPRWLAGFLAWQVVAAMSIRLGVNLFNYDAVKWVGKISPRPLFLLHGGTDRYIPDFDEMVKAAGTDTEVWDVPGIGHTQVINEMHEEYLNRVSDFIDRNL